MYLKNEHLYIFVQISKISQKVLVLGLFIAILEHSSPSWNKKRSPSLEEKFESPPLRPFFYPPHAAHHRAQVWRQMLARREKLLLQKTKVKFLLPTYFQLLLFSQFGGIITQVVF